MVCVWDEYEMWKMNMNINMEYICILILFESYVGKWSEMGDVY